MPIINQLKIVIPGKKLTDFTARDLPQTRQLNYHKLNHKPKTCYSCEDNDKCEKLLDCLRQILPCIPHIPILYNRYIIDRSGTYYVTENLQYSNFSP